MKKIILVTVCSLLAFSCTSEERPREVFVNGHCLKLVKPDRGSISFYAESINKDSKQALKEATEIYEQARTAVKEMELKGLELSSLENSVHEERRWENGKSKSLGYKARIGLRVFTTEVEKMGQVVAIVSAKGIRNIGRLQTDMSPQNLKREKEKCLSEAILNAKEKAKSMAETAGARIGSVVSIKEIGAQKSSPSPRLYMAEAASLADSGAKGASIDTKAEELSVSVEVVFALK